MIKKIAKSLCDNARGVLAIDETVGTLTKRFEAHKIESTAESRRDYRELLCAAPGLSKYVSGVILFDETIWQVTWDKVAFPKFLEEHALVTGIKVDTRTWDLAGFPGETVTEGLDGLRDRLRKYFSSGARFCKWRAVFEISKETPTAGGIVANAHALGRYASLCQENGLVPIVEPEVLMDGDHSLARCEEVTRLVLSAVFTELERFRVDPEGILLKPNMVIEGKEHGKRSTPQEVAESTIRVLRSIVPDKVPGVIFLSGGQDPVRATEHLDAINKVAKSAPWKLSFSFGRALQDDALETWKGQKENVEDAQCALLRRAQFCSMACAGQYSRKMEEAG
jgi:fructose-bisphosphate aldolase, class I